MIAKISNIPKDIVHRRADKFGVIASILCAIHCALTPFLLILLPTFGKAWSHPATHWGMALIVIPIAVMMMRKSYKKHSKKWIIAVGSLGILFIIVGSILPYIETSPKSTESSSVATKEAPVTVNPATEVITETPKSTQTSSRPKWLMAGTLEKKEELKCSASGGCVDGCCPSIVENAAGEKSLYIPPASIVTTLGGLCLIILHVFNLRSCICCEKEKEESACNLTECA